MKKPNWIYHPETSMFDPECYVCSECGGMIGLDDRSNECPHCHVIMEEV